MTPAALIEIRNATICRGETSVFEGLNLSIGQRERVAILGPNGSGKTTLLKTINRELYPVAGPQSSIRILGRERWNVWDLRSSIGIVSDDLERRYDVDQRAIDVVLSGFFASVGVHGTLASRVSDEQRAAASAALAELGMAGCDDIPLGSMSTGQRRRCLLARALVHRPAALILDEPTAGLDIAAAFDVLGRLRDLSRRGTSIVIVTHHLNEVPPDIERVILLDAGRIVADGPRAEVLTANRLTQVYGTPIRVAHVDGYYLAYPG